MLNVLLKKQWIQTKAITVKANCITQTKRKEDMLNTYIFIKTFFIHAKNIEVLRR